MSETTTIRYNISSEYPLIFHVAGTYTITAEPDRFYWQTADGIQLPGTMAIRLRPGEKATLCPREACVKAIVMIAMTQEPLRTHLLPALTADMLMTETERKDALYKKEAERLQAEIISQVKRGCHEIYIAADNSLGLVQDIIAQMHDLGFGARTSEAMEPNSVCFRRVLQK